MLDIILIPFILCLALSLKRRPDSDVVCRIRCNNHPSGVAMEKNIPSSESLTDRPDRPFALSLCLVVLMLTLCACSRKEVEPPGIVNWTLPNISDFQAEYLTAEKEPSPQEVHTTGAQAVKWKPHGNYTYVTGSGSGYSTALFKIYSADYETRCAVVAYTVKDSSGYEQAKASGEDPAEENYFFESGGEQVVGLEEKTDAEGVRHVILYLSKEHYLEFTGKEKLEQAKYCYKALKYRLKYEG